MGYCCCNKYIDVSTWDIQADFLFEDGYFGINEPISFSDQSTGSPVQWFWDFGDGGISSLQNPSHPYAAPGVYIITFLAYKPGIGGSPGVSDQIQKIITIASESFSPLLLNPDLFLDATGLGHSEANDYGVVNNHYLTSLWNNRSSVVGVTDAIQATVESMPVLMRQEMAGYNALNFGATAINYLELAKYSAINYNWNQAFWISLMLKTTISLVGIKKVIIDSRGVTGVSGMLVYMMDGKMTVEFYDSAGIKKSATSNTLINDGNPRHFVFTNAGTGAASFNFYVDGTLTTKTVNQDDALISTMAVIGNSYRIGASYDLDKYWIGEIGHLIMKSGTIS